MLLGQYDGKADEKGRIAFPKKLRTAIGNKIIVTFGYENSLIVVSEENWKSLLEGTKGKPFIQKDARETQRFLLGGASFVELDSKGRFVLPAYLREFAKVTGEIVFLGLFRYVEIWDKKRWLEYMETLQKSIDTIAKRLTEREEGYKG
ncbi:MAG: division/cell wall cluster transcriptional repressor MraZ [Candidatus Levyibacteriota bacterium]|nr:MAG: division/cell wall cluster transcriptional repressor MraZ [Candidatus Levybacteria bacterium]